MVYRTYISIFNIIGWVDQSKACTLIYLQKIASYINLQLPIVIFKELIMSDMHRGKSYMYVNFQQNRVNRSISHNRAYKFIRKKIASCINLQIPIQILKNPSFQTCIIVKCTRISIFSKIGLGDLS